MVVLEALGPLGAIIASAMVALADGAVFKFWRRRVPSQRLRIARYLSILSWMCQAQSGWPKWQKYHALRGDTALEPKFYVTKRLALPCAASDFSPPEGAEGVTHAWPRSRLIPGFGGEGKVFLQATIVFDVTERRTSQGLFNLSNQPQTFP